MELYNLLNELKVYKDFDKNEKIKNLSCKPGDDIYIINLSNPDGYERQKIMSIEIYKNSIYLNTRFSTININELNDSFFLSKEEAKKAIKLLYECEIEKKEIEKAEIQEIFSQGDYES